MDFKEAFDTVEWSYLDYVMSLMGFLLEMARLDLPTHIFCLSFCCYQWREGLDKEVHYLLYFLIFLLNRKATSIGLFNCAQIGCSSLMISHLQGCPLFPLFCNPDLKQLMNIKRILNRLHLISGLKINFSKSCLIGANMEQQLVHDWAIQINCKAKQLPSKYLDIPLAANSLNCWYLNPGRSWRTWSNPTKRSKIDEIVEIKYNCWEIN